jgi:hypothetical protein
MCRAMGPLREAGPPAARLGGKCPEFSVAPAADYFVIPNLSVGGNILFGVFSPAQGSGANAPRARRSPLVGIAPRVGYNLPITDMISFWPKVYFSYVTANGSSATRMLRDPGAPPIPRALPFPYLSAEGALTGSG